MVPSILPKNERKQFIVVRSSFFVLFWKNWRYQKDISRFKLTKVKKVEDRNLAFFWRWNQMKIPFEIRPPLKACENQAIIFHFWVVPFVWEKTCFLFYRSAKNVREWNLPVCYCLGTFTIIQLWSFQLFKTIYIVKIQ